MIQLRIQHSDHDRNQRGRGIALNVRKNRLEAFQ